MDDVIIVGGSFAGLTAALQIVRTGRSVTVLDTKLPRNRFAHAAQGVLGYDGVSPWDIRARGEANVLAYPTARIEAANAVSASQIEGGFAITDADGKERTAKRLILAYGITDIMPDLPGFAACWGDTVASCPYCHGYEVAGQRLGVLYSLPASLHAANLVRDWSPRLTLFTNANIIPDPDRDMLLAKGVTIIDTPVTALLHDAGKLTSVQLATGDSVPLDALFAHPRNAPSSSLHQTLGLATTDGPLGPLIQIDERAETSLKGVYAAGDATTAMASITFALASGALAGVTCHQSLL